MNWTNLHDQDGIKLSVLVEQGKPTRASLTEPTENEVDDDWVYQKLNEAFPDWSIQLVEWLLGSTKEESVTQLLSQPNIFREID